LSWNGQLPNLQDSTANFSNIGAAAVVSANSDEHVGQLQFDNPSGYTINGTGDISMDVLSHNNAGYATVNVNSGTQVIAVPLNLLSDTHFTVAGGSLLDVQGNLTASGINLTMAGNGYARFNNIRGKSLNITGGDVLIRQSATANAGTGISVLGGLQVINTSYMDLSNNAMILPYSSGTGSTAMTAVRGMLNGGQLVSSAADASHRLGYFDNSVLGITNFNGLNPGSSSVIVAFVNDGDTNFSGTVDETDFLTFEANYGTSSGATWQMGDFDYNGTVDANDFRLFVAGLLASGGTITPDMVSFGASIGVPLPEPGTISVLALGCATLLPRRRRRSVMN
jgi:hypothetical protein